MTNQTIESLREAYGKIQRVDPSSKSYAEICAVLDGANDKALQTLADANIKWISMLANTRIIRRKMAGTWSLLGPHHDKLIAAAEKVANKM